MWCAPKAFLCSTSSSFPRCLLQITLPVGGTGVFPIHQKSSSPPLQPRSGVILRNVSGWDELKLSQVSLELPGEAQMLQTSQMNPTRAPLPWWCRFPLFRNQGFLFFREKLTWHHHGRLSNLLDEAQTGKAFTVTQRGPLPIHPKISNCNVNRRQTTKEPL